MWKQITITTSAQHAEQLSDFLFAEGALSVTLVDAEDQPLLEPELNTMPIWARANVIALFEMTDDVEKILQRAQIMHATLNSNSAEPLSCHSEIIRDENWQDEWKKYFKPVCFANKLWICPSWSALPDDTNAVIVSLDPGLAFGTGTHATTALCLQWLAENSVALTNSNVIDFGCGSGILAIAAAKLGAARVVATDHDPQALEATHTNATNNHCAENVLHTCFPNQMPLTATTDILIANILAKPLMTLAEHFAQLVTENGQIILSGILAEQAEELIAAYQPWFTLQLGATQEGWVRLEGVRRTGKTNNHE